MDENESGPWIGLITSPSYTWVDNTGLTYVNWAEGEPNNINAGEACGQMYKTGAWNDENCDYQNPYICQKIARYENCEFAKSSTGGFPEQVGPVGINEVECVFEYNACWDPFSPVKCYQEGFMIFPIFELF